MYAFLEDEGSLSPETAFVVFLKWVEGGPGPTDDPTASAPWARLLHAAAIGGVQQARALIFRYYEFQGYELNDDIKSKVVDWSLESISTGALAFSNEVRKMDGLRFDAALKLFQESGGFNQHYSEMSPQIFQEHLSPPPSIPLSSESLREPLNRWGDGLPHILASFNHTEAINALKSIMTRETPLYRACECGAFETVIFLLDLGANPSIRPHRKGPSCLHWLFAFHPDHIDLVARRLIEKGASTDVLTDQRVKMFHYPFMLPTGSPLHWAVRLDCIEAVRALLSHGADPFLRDSDRQFIFVSTEPDARPETPNDVPHEEFILGPSAGSSAVDLAVQNWNADMLELLLESSSDISGAETDGIGVPHHLITGDFCWISDHTNSRFYTPYVRGTLEAQGTMLKRTLHVLRQHGFEIDSLAPAWRSGKTSTLLMLAVYAGKIDLVEMLLEAGADVNIVDSDGRTALMYMGVRYGVEFSGEVSDQEAFQTRMTKLLLNHGARIDIRDHQGYSPVLVLASHYLCAATRVLLENGAPANDVATCSGTKRDDVADFPIFGHLAWAALSEADEEKDNAVRAHDGEMASMLRAYVVPLLRERRDHGEFDRNTLLHELALCGLTESATVLLEAGADVNPVTRKPGGTPRTPLDALRNFIDSPANQGSGGLSKAEADKRDRRFENMVGLLTRYGAKRVDELEGRDSIGESE
ncbi:ankyrin repeat-containing domain protein [Xylaria digitata]|nr:ankyrin repeat-containing domain protein [Xylaria digitata]